MKFLINLLMSKTESSQNVEYNSTDHIFRVKWFITLPLKECIQLRCYAVNQGVKFFACCKRPEGNKNVWLNSNVQDIRDTIWKKNKQTNKIHKLHYLQKSKVTFHITSITCMYIKFNNAHKKRRGEKKILVYFPNYGVIMDGQAFLSFFSIMTFVLLKQGLNETHYASWILRCLAVTGYKFYYRNAECPSFLSSFHVSLGSLNAMSL